MKILTDFTQNLLDFLVEQQYEHSQNIIRTHTKKLNELGDLSFPTNTKNWYQFIDVIKEESVKSVNIVKFEISETTRELVTEQLLQKSSSWPIEINKIVFKKADAHIHLKRSPVLYKTVIKHVLMQDSQYGSCPIMSNNFNVGFSVNIEDSNIVNLTTLRMMILKEVAENFIKYNTMESPRNTYNLHFVANAVDNENINILCGPVLNERCIKSNLTAKELYEKRASDMRMMAQHKYGVQIKPSKAWETYFNNIGKGSVTIEMLTNKPQKSIKITPNDLQSANKGASFIFYNCARLSALFKEFEKRVMSEEYPRLPDIDEIDFHLIDQPEEWELFYVYILQFPLVIKSCVKDIEKGIFNPQYLISFLSNLCSVFSVYYRRVRILTNPREHMFSIIHARIYLLKALQCVFHNSLHLLNIEPIKEM
ncbi:DALR anticodon-binding domain-containing protein 3 isoform X1 [Diabrotica virgifera virgifera]|uniref:DALR anticodon-binding domain-containing protein 3 isoform X1 n=1 Tax=Diabrotica virgifera virgifera TaxID=50390 RepID=A0A6P7GYM8_DIAVI|nr:DALR anticodon-binding domain-containing protein 3 isoform X1 [Diabrotica virgifera virgifera]